MPSQIDPTKPVDGVPANKADLRSNLQSAKDEIEALQSGKADVGHQHGLADISDGGALAGLDQVDTAHIADGAVTQAKIAVDAVGADQLQDGISINMMGALLSGAEFTDYSESSPAPVVSAATLTLDLDSGSVFDVVLTEDVTSLILANPPAAGSAGSATLIGCHGRPHAGVAELGTLGRRHAAPCHAGRGRDRRYCIQNTGRGACWYGFPGGQDFS